VKRRFHFELFLI